MSQFRLHEQIPHWFDQVSIYTSHDIALCAFAIAGGVLVRDVGRAGIYVSPYVWSRCRKTFAKSLKWQVRQAFEWAKWHAHTMNSTRWAVLCALAASAAVGLWINLPLLRPLLYVFVPVSMVAFFSLGWLDRGERATRSVRSVLKFFWSFFVPTWVYVGLALIGYVATVLLGFL